ncbi:MAG: amidohydrolase family protein [Pirellulaceae bacterium]
MRTHTRRRFLSVSASAVAASAVPWATRSDVGVAADNATETKKSSPKSRPQVYAIGKIPRVDIHTHIKIDELQQTAGFVEAMDAAGISVSVNLSCTREMLEQADAIRKKWKGRILLCPGDFDTSDGLWWSEEELAIFRDNRCAGTKIWTQYRQGVLAPEFVKKVQRQGQLGLPVIGFHVADPPEGKFLKPNYRECIREAAKLIERCPETTFIMAHGFWLMIQDRGLDVLSGYFDRYPNLNADLSAVYQWWDPPQPTHKKLRDFIIAYKDRLLFGTDGHPGYTTPERLKRIYQILETSEDHLKGFFRNETNLRGLSLPVDVLTNIYYSNAARLVPEVRRSLVQCGYKLSLEPATKPVRNAKMAAV